MAQMQAIVPRASYEQQKKKMSTKRQREDETQQDAATNDVNIPDDGELIYCDNFIIFS